MNLKTNFYELQILDDLTISYRLPRGKVYTFGNPSFEADGAMTPQPKGARRIEKRTVNAVTEEYVYFAEAGKIGISLLVRVCKNTPFLRYRYTFTSAGPVKMTKADGKDNLIYTRFAAPHFCGTEVRLSEYNHQLYSFCLSETPAFRDEDSIMGPILVGKDKDGCCLFAYEHGSGYPDRYIEFRKAGDQIEISAVKGNYYAGQTVSEDAPYETVWLQFGACAGTEDDMAHLYREFQQKWILPGHSSRKPLLYYNTWNDQEREQLKTGTYHSCMNLEHLLADIDTAHALGIDVFVIDTGWFTRCGDWEVRTDRFPDGLSQIRAKLDGYGMKLGLWINPAAVALSSPKLEENRDCIASVNGVLTQAFNVWESERSHGMCLASRYWRVLADTLIKLCKEKGVSYIKWDAIWQYGCTDGHHLHGTDENSYEERNECYSFNMDRYLSKICDAILEECPDTILDFDITEEGRNVGLSWLSRGKYFLVNNGPNYHNYDLPDPQWTNMFVNPGPARTWICRSANNYDRWIPSNLFLCHFLPDPPADSQRMNIGSMLLGGNGIWGNLHALSAEDVQSMGEIVAAYKKVADDVTETAASIDGTTATTLQKFEKINPANGRGEIVLFGFCGRKNTLVRKIESKCSGKFRIFGDAEIEKRGDDWFIRATFDGADAVIIFCE